MIRTKHNRARPRNEYALTKILRAKSEHKRYTMTHIGGCSGEQVNCGSSKEEVGVTDIKRSGKEPSRQESKTKVPVAMTAKILQVGFSEGHNLK